MLKFNELRIHPITKKLIIDVEVREELSDVYIDCIYLDTQNTFVDKNYPSENAIELYPELNRFVLRTTNNNLRVSNNQVRIAESGTEKRKKVSLEIDLNDINVKDTDLLFIYVVPKGNIPESTEYNVGNLVGVTADLYPIYRTMLDSIKEVQKCCDTPVNTINHLLQFKALELWIKTGQYYEAAKYWNKFFINTKKCSCHA